MPCHPAHEDGEDGYEDHAVLLAQEREPAREEGHRRGREPGNLGPAGKERCPEDSSGRAEPETRRSGDPGDHVGAGGVEREQPEPIHGTGTPSRRSRRMKAAPSRTMRRCSVTLVSRNLRQSGSASRPLGPSRQSQRSSSEASRSAPRPRGGASSPARRPRSQAASCRPPGCPRSPPGHRTRALGSGDRARTPDPQRPEEEPGEHRPRASAGLSAER